MDDNKIEKLAATLLDYLVKIVPARSPSELGKKVLEVALRSYKAVEKMEAGG